MWCVAAYFKKQNAEHKQSIWTMICPFSSRAKINLLQMIFELQPVDKDEMSNVFAIYRTYLFSYVDQAFGWNDGFQASLFKNSYQDATFSWINICGKNCGLLCVKESDFEFHVHLLIVFHEFQSKGIGKTVMNRIHEAARDSKKLVRLSSFKVNQNAVRFYESMGYKKNIEDENFYSLTYSPKV